MEVENWDTNGLFKGHFTLPMTMTISGSARKVSSNTTNFCFQATSTVGIWPHPFGAIVVCFNVEGGKPCNSQKRCCKLSQVIHLPGKKTVGRGASILQDTR